MGSSMKKSKLFCFYLVCVLAAPAFVYAAKPAGKLHVYTDVDDWVTDCIFMQREVDLFSPFVAEHLLMLGQGAAHRFTTLSFAGVCAWLWLCESVRGAVGVAASAAFARSA
jgi:hypothetical protein